MGMLTSASTINPSSIPILAAEILRDMRRRTTAIVERAIMTITAPRISGCRLSFRLGTAAVHNSPAAARVAIMRYVRSQ